MIKVYPIDQCSVVTALSHNDSLMQQLCGITLLTERYNTRLQFMYFRQDNRLCRFSTERRG
jgi:hypothetical protein